MKKRLADFIFSNDSSNGKNVNESVSEKIDINNWQRLAGIHESQDLFAGKDLNDRAISDFEIALEGVIEDLQAAGCTSNPRVYSHIRSLEDKVEKAKAGMGHEIGISTESVELSRVIKACPELQGPEKFRARLEISNRILHAGKKFEEDVYASKKPRSFMHI